MQWGVAAYPCVVNPGTCFSKCRACYPTTHPVQALLGFSAALAPKLSHIVLEMCSASSQEYVFAKNSKRFGTLWCFWNGIPIKQCLKEALSLDAPWQQELMKTIGFYSFWKPWCMHRYTPKPISLVKGHQRHIGAWAPWIKVIYKQRVS